MNETSSQQRENEGTYVARLNGEIVLSALTYDELRDEMENPRSTILRSSSPS